MSALFHFISSRKCPSDFLKPIHVILFSACSNHEFRFEQAEYQLFLTYIGSFNAKIVYCCEDDNHCIIANWDEQKKPAVKDVI